MGVGCMVVPSLALIWGWGGGGGGVSESRLFLEHPKTENQTSTSIFGSVYQNGGVKVWQDWNWTFCFILWTFITFHTVCTHGHKTVDR